MTNAFSFAAILATVAVIASAAPAINMVGDVDAAFWTSCGSVLKSSNVFSPANPFNPATFNGNSGVWYLNAFDSAWMKATGGDPSVITCSNFTFSAYDSSHNSSTINLYTNPPAKTVSWPVTLVNTPASDLPQAQILYNNNNDIQFTGLSFVALDDANAGVVGCTWTKATPSTPTYFWSVLSHSSIQAPDGGVWGKIQAVAKAQSSTLNVADNNVGKSGNTGCPKAPPSGANQVTAMSGLLFAALAFLCSRFMS